MLNQVRYLNMQKPSIHLSRGGLAVRSTQTFPSGLAHSGSLNGWGKGSVWVVLKKNMTYVVWVFAWLKLPQTAGNCCC